MLKPWLQVSGPVLQPIPSPCQPLLLPSTPEAALPAAATSCCRAGLAPWHRGGDYKSYWGLPAAQFPQNSFFSFVKSVPAIHQWLWKRPGARLCPSLASSRTCWGWCSLPGITAALPAARWYQKEGKRREYLELRYQNYIVTSKFYLAL